VNNKDEKKEEIQFETKLDEEALNLIFKLYDLTFKDLANR
jgi:hypothetical protein